jgi:fibronectin type 3 domain-containing protein
LWKAFRNSLSDQLTTIVRLDDPSIAKTEDTSFVFGVNYRYTVSSLDEAGESGCARLDAICIRAPTPSDLIASYTEPKGKIITLRWTPVMNGKGYVVKRAVNASVGPFSIIKKIVDPSTKHFEDTKVLFATKYYYTITTVGGIGESNNAHFVGIICPWTPIPTGLNACTTNAGSSIIVQWKPVVNVKAYIVRRAESSAKDIFVTIKTVNDPSITHAEDTSFMYGINYYYTVASIDEGSESNQSDSVGIYIRAPPPMNVVASFESSSNNFISLQWEPLLKAKGYIVKRATNSTSSPFLDIGTLNDSSIAKFEDTSILFGADYTYSIISRDKAGESARSSEVHIICPRLPPPKKSKL